MDISFKIEKVNAFYNNTVALKDVSFDIPEKSVTAVIGPSGCGKSTFIRCLNRMDIYSEEIDVIDIRRQIGMVFQKPNPFPKSIYENTAYGVRIQGFNKKG